MGMPIFGPAGEADSTCSEARMQQQQTEKRSSRPHHRSDAGCCCKTSGADSLRVSHSFPRSRQDKARKKGSSARVLLANETCAIPCPYSARKKDLRIFHRIQTIQCKRRSDWSWISSCGSRPVLRAEKTSAFSNLL